VSGSALPRAAAALVLVDVVQPFDFDGSEDLLEHARPASKALAKLKKRAKAAGLPVVYANDHFGGWREDFSTLVARCLKAGSPGRAVVKRLQPQEDDYYVLKPEKSAFYAAPLEVLLKHFGARTVVLTGFAGDICVFATALDAHMRGLRLVVPADCTASQSADANRRALAYLRRVCDADTAPSTALDLAVLAGG
jgi:nicotinamidase-related amidase